MKRGLKPIESKARHQRWAFNKGFLLMWGEGGVIRNAHD